MSKLTRSAILRRYLGQSVVRVLAIGQCRPKLIAPGKVPPFVRMSGEPGVSHDPMEKAPIGARFRVGIRQRCRFLEVVAMGKLRYVVEDRSHPELIAADPADREIKR